MKEKSGFFKSGHPRGPSMDFHNKMDKHLDIAPHNRPVKSSSHNPQGKSSFKPDSAEYPKGHARKNK